VAPKKSSTLIFLPSVGYRGPVAVGEQGKDELEPICQALNSTEQPELRDNLRRLIERWQASGPNLEKMMYGDLELFTEVQLACRARWTPGSEGRAFLYLMPDYQERRERKVRQGQDGKWRTTPEAQAIVLFHFLTLNPQCEKLAGPCARCGNYYVKKRASQKVYCSRRCGNAATAVARTRVRLKAEHEDKMLRAKTVIQEWNALESRPMLDWQLWLKRRDPGITKKFVTRWANKGELPQPKEARKPDVHVNRNSRTSVRRRK